MKIQIENQQKRIKIDKRKIRTEVTELLKLLDCANKEISLTFVDDTTIQRINRQYLSRDKSTNVISFSLQEGEFGGVNPEVLGDIVISVDTASRDADQGHLSFDEEILFLIIHGLLHLLGYNHEDTSKTNALKMKRKEKKLFRLLTQAEYV
jgi:probable rRNA maturation factor